MVEKRIPDVLWYDEVEHLPKQTHWDPARDAMVWTFTFIDDSTLQYVALDRLYLISIKK